MACHDHTAKEESSCHSHGRWDYLLLISGIIIAVAYLAFLFAGGQMNEKGYLHTFTHSAYELLNTMWWGLALGIVFVGMLAHVPKEFVLSVIGKPGSKSGVVRATLAGLLLDLCSHGILLVGMQLYRRGASYGQVLAFLIASPWNSLSLTIILVSLIGLQWTLVFIAASAAIAISAGYLADVLLARGVLPTNPNDANIPDNFAFFAEARQRIQATTWNAEKFKQMALDGLSESRMILRWILFGIVLASAIRTFVDPAQFQNLFGPTLAGLGLTILAATIIEVCSEGSTPIAADILTRGNAPGNSFAFLMTGVSTDYTEIMGIKETTGRWKLAFFLPLLTLPQTVMLAMVMNGW